MGDIYHGTGIRPELKGVREIKGRGLKKGDQRCFERENKASKPILGRSGKKLKGFGIGTLGIGIGGRALEVRRNQVIYSKKL